MEIDLKLISNIYRNNGLIIKSIDKYFILSSNSEFDFYLFNLTIDSFSLFENQIFELSVDLKDGYIYNLIQKFDLTTFISNDKINLYRKNLIREDIFIEIILPIRKNKYNNILNLSFNFKKKGIPTNEKTINITQSTEQELFKYPRTLPSIKIDSSKLGVNKITIKKFDNNVKSILLLRKQINDYIFEQVKTYENIDLTKELIIYDKISNKKPFLYRAICLNENGVMSGEFSEDFNYYGSNRDSIILDSEINFYGFCNENSIKLILSNVPINESILIYRKKQQHTKFELLSLPLKENNGKVEFDDINVQHNNIYQYKFLLNKKNGSIKDYNKELLIRFVNAETKNIEINNFNFNTETKNLTFEINIIENLTESDQIKKIISNNQLLEYYKTEIKTQNFVNLFSFLVKRINMNTGEIENIGILNENKYSSNYYENKLNIKPFIEGYEYKYIIEVKTRNPDSLFKDLITNKDNYSFKPFTWLNPITLNEGTLTSEKTKKLYHSQNDFEIGELIGYAEKTIKINSNIPTVNFNIENIKKGIKKVNILISGNSKLIDYIQFYDITSSFTKKISILNNQSYLYLFNNNKDAEYKAIIVYGNKNILPKVEKI